MVAGERRPHDVLLAEDNPDDARRIEDAVDEARPEATVHVVADGEEALEFLRRRGEYADAPVPDAVLLDWNLPGVDGERVLDELKAEHPETPVVVLTSMAVEEAAVESKTVQADAVVRKSEDPDVYVDAVESVAGRVV